jgi:hypothetical protein
VHDPSRPEGLLSRQLFLAKPGDVTLEEDSIGILANIQSGCANLRTLTTSL